MREPLAREAVRELVSADRLPISAGNIDRMPLHVELPVSCVAHREALLVIFTECPILGLQSDCDEPRF